MNGHKSDSQPVQNPVDTHQSMGHSGVSMDAYSVESSGCALYLGEKGMNSQGSVHEQRADTLLPGSLHIDAMDHRLFSRFVLGLKIDSQRKMHVKKVRYSFVIQSIMDVSMEFREVKVIRVSRK